MKKFIYVIFVCFFILMAFTFYMAFSTFDGLVEPGYYEKSMDYFKQKEAEEALGLSVLVPEKLGQGTNAFKVEVITAGGPLTGASVSLYVGNVKSTESDVSFALKETSPGVYESDIAIPSAGKWLMRLEIEHESIRTEKRWFVAV